MKKLWTIILLMLLPATLMALEHGLQIGIHGGYSYSHEGGLDLNYIVRAHLSTNSHLGLHTGVGATYSSFQLQDNITNHFSRKDYLGNTIEYTTSAHVQEQHSAIGVSVPLLLSLQVYGFTLNLGSRALWMTGDKYQQQIDEAHIDAYFPAYKVHVIDHPSTGRLTTPYQQSGVCNLINTHLLVSGEIGYEWHVGNRYSRNCEQYFGIQLYANYSVKSWTKQNNEPVLSVVIIPDADSPAQITTQSIFGTSSLHYMNIGIRLYYTIQTVDYHVRGWHKRHYKQPKDHHKLPFI